MQEWELNQFESNEFKLNGYQNGGQSDMFHSSTRTDDYIPNKPEPVDEKSDRIMKFYYESVKSLVILGNSLKTIKEDQTTILTTLTASQKAVESTAYELSQITNEISTAAKAVKELRKHTTSQSDNNLSQKVDNLTKEISAISSRSKLQLYAIIVLIFITIGGFYQQRQALNQLSTQLDTVTKLSQFSAQRLNSTGIENGTKIDKKLETKNRK